MEIRKFNFSGRSANCCQCKTDLDDGDRYVDIENEYLICATCIKSAYEKIMEIDNA